MKEIDFGHRPFSRRSILKGVTLIGATAMAAGNINDANQRIESIDIPEQITPIYGSHVAGVEAFENGREFNESVTSSGVFPESKTWPDSTKRETRKVRPQILAIDGLSYTPLAPNKDEDTITNLWYLSPGNPFHINPNSLRIISADVPSDVLGGYEKYPNLYLDQKPTPEIITALNGIRDHFEQTTGLKADADINMIINPKNISKFYDYELYEGGVSNFGLGFGSLMYLTAESTIRKKPISRRKFMALGGLATIGFANTARIYGDYILESDDGLYNPLYAPISTVGMIGDHLKKVIPYAELRNALISIKLEETEKALGTGTVKKSAVMGSAHQIGKPVWYSQFQRYKVLETRMKEIFEFIKKQPTETVDRQKVIETVGTYFGGVRVFNVGNEPDSKTLESIKQNISIETSFISPVVKEAVEQAAAVTGYI